ncbi:MULTISPECIES: lipase family protein [unclassified Rhodococcus (in: high G+C Gram-positive bacteria)]|uniref:lipase family protein n=1 Tax=unclassified Rhodococcus (in: high G+C Gram-positive bacteria) TaxID=192944 RepID=UPI00163B264D|nr:MULTISPECIES: lipase family protein [unclassified Rhodococcus (in: high G+C Gram-positive bacteria)]MBC2643578.1 lipase [Rhodococcus sp. 3A]MBC2891681.1 lipase [Rhodococcus sp. 4CII]
MGSLFRRSSGTAVLGSVLALSAALVGAGTSAAEPPLLSPPVLSPLLPAPPSADAIFPVADPDPFYIQPSDVADHAPGDVLKIRQMPPSYYFPGSAMWELLFRTTDSEGRPIAANTTYVLPANHVPDGPLVSYQHIINSLGNKCKIANELYTDDPLHQIREAAGLNIALARGWAVALPDHLGPRMAYGAAKLGGQITLDGIRAVQRVPELQVQNSKVGLGGYSGGGMATAWAAALAPTYAPELNIVGAAEGGTPMNLVKMAEALGTNPHPAFGLAMAAALGLEREYPDRIDVTDQLNDEGRIMKQMIGNGCTNEIMLFGLGHSASQMTDNKNFMDDPEAWKVMEENSLELYPGVPTAPIFEWHSPTDALIPVDSIDTTVKRYCDAGTPVQTLLTPTPDHLSAAALGLPQGLDWMDARFRGDPAPSTC